MPIFDAGTAQLDVSLDGHPAGPVAILLHGLSSSRANDAAAGLDWSRALGAHRVVSYDARGHGRSTGRSVPEDYAWSALADDLIALADTYSPDHPVDVIGTSMGTGTILHAVLSRPDRFRRLVLALPPTAWATRAAQQDLYRDGADFVERNGMARFVAAGKLVEPPPAVPDGWPDPDVNEDVLPAILRGAALSDLPEPFELAAVSQPTLVLAWVDDPGHPLATAERLADLIPHATLRIAQDPDDLAEWPAIAGEFLHAAS